MSEPWGLLVVPSEALRGMLGTGPCGFRPPSAYRELRQVEHPTAEELELSHADFDGWAHHWLPNYGTMEIDRECDALVLRWEGRDQPHGWLAAGLALGLPWTDVFDAVNGVSVADLRRAGCAVIALDADRREAPHGG